MRGGGEGGNAQGLLWTMADVACTSKLATLCDTCVSLVSLGSLARRFLREGAYKILFQWHNRQ